MPDPLFNLTGYVAGVIGGISESPTVVSGPNPHPFACVLAMPWAQPNNRHVPTIPPCQLFTPVVKNDLNVPNRALHLVNRLLNVLALNRLGQPEASVGAAVLRVPQPSQG
jgi:hypothetical protein